MTKWVRFSQGGTNQFGTLENDLVRVFEGDMFNEPKGTLITHAVGDVKLLYPSEPTKIIAMWNNFRALGEKLNLAIPEEPLYLIKAPNSYLNPGETICGPHNCGKVAFEGELGIVIGKRCKEVSEASAADYVFGYTCANDVTVNDVLTRDASFKQWVRAKSFDTFCPFGPVIDTDAVPAELIVRTMLNGEVRQQFPISDMLFSVSKLVSLISQDMTLLPGDVILCGTSLGVGTMKSGSVIEVEIDGIGKLTNLFQ